MMLIAVLAMYARDSTIGPTAEVWQVTMINELQLRQKGRCQPQYSTAILLQFKLDAKAGQADVRLRTARRMIVAE